MTEKERIDRLAASIAALPEDRRRELEKLLTRPTVNVQEAAAILGVHDETVRRAIKGGRLRAFRVGAGRAPYRIALSDLDRFMGGEN